MLTIAPPLPRLHSRQHRVAAIVGAVDVGVDVVGEPLRASSASRLGLFETPALLIRMSTGPREASSRGEGLLHRGRVADVDHGGFCRDPFLAKLGGEARVTAGLRSSAAIVAPSPPKWRQSSRPIPPAAPVIATTFPLNCTSTLRARRAPRRSSRGCFASGGRNCRRRCPSIPASRSAATAPTTSARLCRSGHAGRRMPRSVPVSPIRRFTSKMSARMRATLGS